MRGSCQGSCGTIKIPPCLKTTSASYEKFSNRTQNNTKPIEYDVTFQTMLNVIFPSQGFRSDKCGADLAGGLGRCINDNRMY